jgi:Putative Ig domain/Ricin-type beta-trefoil lectin domain
MRGWRSRSWQFLSLTVAALVLPFGLAVATASPGYAAAHTSQHSVSAAAGRVRPQATRRLSLPSGVRTACPVPPPPGHASCLALVRTKLHGVRPDDVSPNIYGPSELQTAYNLTADSVSDGGGETVAVVDAYNDPKAASDLAVYRKQWGLPACNTTTGAGCVTVVNQEGATHPLPQADPTGGWELEESLDLDMVSAICPNCHIILAEANSNLVTDLSASENAAVDLGAKFVSDSWGGGPDLAVISDFDHPGVAITVAAGDFGYGSDFPAMSQFVTSVGGTTLIPDPGTARGYRETAWGLNSGNGATASGCASDPIAGAKPAWQAVDDNAAHGCLNRTENDVSAVADPNSPVWVYDTYPSFDVGGTPDWVPEGGTSASSPIIAAVYALAGTPTAGTYPASYLYQSGHSSHLYPVTSGSNGYCQPAYLCNAADDYAGTTYNAPTGWGTPDGTAAFKNSATTDTITVPDPGAVQIVAGSKISVNASAVDSASGKTLAYSATGLPAGVEINASSGLISGKLSSAAATSTVTVTATDGTGAKGSVTFHIVAVANLRSGLHRVAGPVTLHTSESNRTNMCMYDAGNSGANGAKVEVWKCDGQPAERWTYLPDPGPDSNGSLVIHGKCATIGKSGRIVLEKCTGAANQGWSLQFAASFLFNLASQACLNDPGDSTRDGTQLDITICQAAFSQTFVLPAEPLLSGVGERCLTDPGNSTRAGTAAEAVRCNGSQAQLWSVLSDWNITQHGNLCLSAAGNSFSPPGEVPGTPVLVASCAGQTFWVPGPEGQVVNELNGLCLDNPGGPNAPAAKLLMEQCYGNAGEVWAEG